MSETPITPTADTSQVTPSTCGGAVWVKHHVSGKDALQCQRIGGKDGALYLNPNTDPCARCRYSPKYAGFTPDMVERHADAMARGIGMSEARGEAALRAMLAKGRIGADLSQPETKDLFQRALIKAVERGMLSSSAQAIAERLGLARD